MTYTADGHIRAIGQGNWLYAIYYSENSSNFEYEMYNLKNNPDQLHNLLYKDNSSEIAIEANKLHHKLKEKIDQAGLHYRLDFLGLKSHFDLTPIEFDQSYKAVLRSVHIRTLL